MSSSAPAATSESTALALLAMVWSGLANRAIGARRRSLTPDARQEGPPGDCQAARTAAQSCSGGEHLATKALAPA